MGHRKYRDSEAEKAIEQLELTSENVLLCRDAYGATPRWFVLVVDVDGSVSPLGFEDDRLSAACGRVLHKRGARVVANVAEALEIAATRRKVTSTDE
jgi:hypothetical protein